MALPYDDCCDSVNCVGHSLFLHTQVRIATIILTRLHSLNWLYYRIVRPANKYVYGVLLFLSFATFGSGLASGVKIFSIVTYASLLLLIHAGMQLADLVLWTRPLDMSALNTPLTVWLSLEMIVDISICGVLSRSRWLWDMVTDSGFSISAHRALPVAHWFWPVK